MKTMNLWHNVENVFQKGEDLKYNGDTYCEWDLIRKLMEHEIPDVEMYDLYANKDGVLSDWLANGENMNKVYGLLEDEILSYEDESEECKDYSCYYEIEGVYVWDRQNLRYKNKLWLTEDLENYIARWLEEKLEIELEVIENDLDEYISENVDFVKRELIELLEELIATYGGFMQL